MKKRAPTRPAEVAKAIKPKLDGLSQREIAIAVPCAQATVSRALARGDIKALDNGRLPESAIETLKKLREEEQADDAAEKTEIRDLNKRLLTAQAGEREAKMELRRMEVERESGRFVELAVVEEDAEDANERICGVLRAIPQRTAMALECNCRRAAVVEVVIAGEVERAIAELGESKYAGGKR